MDLPLDALKPAATPSAPAAPDVTLEDGSLSPEALLKIPAVSDLVQGHIPAVYVTASAVGGPEVLAQQVGPAQAILPKLNLALYQAQKSAALVFYNPKETTEAVLSRADQNGTLGDIAIPLGDAQHHLPSSGAPATDATQAASQVAPQVTPQGPAPGATALANARAALLAPQPPTKQAMPASGILNDLLARPK